MKTFEQRIDELGKILETPSFWKSDGRANEVNYWVFDYPANKELEVRQTVKRLVKRSQQSYREYKLVEFDIYDFIIDTLTKEGYLDATYMMEETAGMHVVIDSIFELLQFNDRDNWFIKYVQENTPDEAIVLLTGVGKVFPILRSHKILNNLSMA
ncbi:MAG: BREX protein BrxB domain-containing protein, partial [Phascolarctobacterium sp.]